MRHLQPLPTLPKPTAPDNTAKAPEPAKAEPAPPPASAATPPAAAGGMATAADIKAKIIGNTVIGTMESSGAYTEYYDPDGTVVGSDYTGKWSLEGDKMCFVYGSDPKECLDVQIKDAKLSWMKFAVEIGSGSIVPGNPSKLMGAAAEPEAAAPEAAAPEAAAPATKSEKRDMATFPCSELVAAYDRGSKEELSTIKLDMFWMSGYASPGDQGIVFDAKAIKADTDRIVAQCRKQPKVGVLTTANKIMGEKGTKPGRNAVDIATITCKAVAETVGGSKEAEKDDLLSALIWLNGYHSAYNKETLMDTAVISSGTANIIKFCAENPETSLATAAKKFMEVEKQ